MNVTIQPKGAPAQAERPRAAFSGFAKVWLDEHIRLRRKPSVVRGYEQALRVHLVPHFKDRQLQAITRRDVEAFVARLAATPHPDTGKPRAPKSVNNVLGVLSSMLSTAVEWGYLERSPCAGVEPLPVPVESQEFAFYTTEQTARWLATCAEIERDYYPLCLLAFRTGLRLGELAAQPPPAELAERVAGWLWLQARSASGAPVWWDGTRGALVQGSAEGREILTTNRPADVGVRVQGDLFTARGAA